MMVEQSIHPSKSAPPALVVFCGCSWPLAWNFYSGWRRAAMLVLVMLLLILLGEGGVKDGGKSIHPSIN